MKAKKIAAVAVAGTMLAGILTGCGSSGGTNGEITLTVWGDPSNQSVLEGAFNEINEAFEKEHPNINIDYQWTGSFENINVATQSDSLPDLFWVQGNKSTKMEELAKGGYILNLDEYKLDPSRYPESAIEYSTVDGSVYCNYPAFYDFVVIYYNQQIFDENGVEVPTTYSEFEEAMKTFIDKGITPVSAGGSGEFDRYWLMQAMAPAICTDTMDAIKNHEEPDYEPMQKLFDKYREYCEKGYFGKDFQSTDGVGAQLAFTNGNAAMIIDGTWNNALYRDLSFEVGAFAMPDDNGTRYAQSGDSNFTTYAVSSKTEYPEEAVEYLKFLGTKEAEQIIENYAGSVPQVTDIEPKDELIEQFAAVDEIGSNIYHVLTSVADEQGKPQDVFLGEVCPKLMTSEIDGKQGVEMIKEELAKSSAK